MKKLLIILIACLPILVQAQQAGEIIFEEKIHFKIELDGEMEGMAAMLPEFQTSQQSLKFNESMSLYKPAEEQEDTEINRTEGDNEFRFVMRRPETALFKDMEAAKRTELRELFGKRFLIEDALVEYKWKLGAEQKEIHGYVCQKAMLQDTSRTVEAWFTPQIPISNGPGNFGQLPGMILELSIDDGERTYTAKEINMGAEHVKDMNPPKKGKIVSQEEFDAIQKAKLEEMNAEMGGNGTMKVIIRN
ncbi:MAG: GLPGLI family protein [Bacteroidota bacterium]